MEHPLTDNWFILRDLTRPNAKRPAYRLLEEKGIEIFTPMRWRLVERKGKRIREEVPLLHDLLFAHTTRTCMDPIVEEISTLQYRYLRGGYRKPMTVGHAEMNRFIHAVHSDDSPRYFLVEELTPAMYGRMIRIEGGPLDGYEGRLLSIRGSRVKRLIVEIPGLLVAAVEVDRERIGWRLSGLFISCCVCHPKIIGQFQLVDLEDSIILYIFVFRTKRMSL